MTPSRVVSRQGKSLARPPEIVLTRNISCWTDCSLALNNLYRSKTNCATLGGEKKSKVTDPRWKGELELISRGSRTVPFHTYSQPEPLKTSRPPPQPSPIHPPVRVFLQSLDRFLDVADIPELDLAVVSTAGQVVLPVGVEVQVTHQLAMSVLYTVDLTGEEREREKRGMWEDRRC